LTPAATDTVPPKGDNAPLALVTLMDRVEEAAAAPADESKKPAKKTEKKEAAKAA